MMGLLITKAYNFSSSVKCLMASRHLRHMRGRTQLIRLLLLRSAAHLMDLIEGLEQARTADLRLLMSGTRFPEGWYTVSRLSRSLRSLIPFFVAGPSRVLFRFTVPHQLTFLTSPGSAFLVLPQP